MTLSWATGTHQGLVRSNNQDTVFPEASGTVDVALVVAVADGMGGHVAGEIASSVALAAAVATDGSPGQRVAAGNEAVVARSEQDSTLRGMGTTITLAEIAPDGRLVIGHVGDSRAYLLRNDAISQLTRDHTVVAEYVASGKINPEDVASHPQRSVLTRAAGLTRDLPIDQLEERMVAGDRLILCSDGLSNMIDDDAIRRIASDGTAEATVWALIEAANQAGGHDNITVAVVDLLP
ncbi:MAG: protein phosphatase 2C domain-containing protein [Acidimicrobiia bacterium]|nr:protein phosphatase 2C domain-containing protein [Acidimicrobiia bacterium]